MPVSLGTGLMPRRVAWPRQSAGRDGAEVVPALLTAVPVRAYVGRSRFVLTPLSLSLDQLLFLITAALLCFGLVMVQSADSRIHAGAGTAGGAGAGGVDGWVRSAFDNKNVVHAGIALLVMTIMWRLDYRVFLGRVRGNRGGGSGGGAAWGMVLSPASWLLVVTVGLLLAVLVTPLGREMNGARRWLALGPLGFQPSELAKLSLVLFVGAYAVHQAANGGETSGVRRFWGGFVPLMVAIGAAMALVVKEDFGTTVLIAAVVFAMIMMAGCRWWHLGLLIPPAAGVVYKMLHTPFRAARLLAFRDPWADSQGAGYHVVQSLLTIASGAPWGRGLGNGIQKMGYLPEDNTDFIFAVICEELGVIGALMVVALFVAFVLVGWRVMSRCHNLFGKMVAFGITAIIGLQAAINIAVVTASMPTKGIALPLISSGGTGWIMNAAAIGVLMSIERINRREMEGTRAAERGGRGFPVEVRAVLENKPQAVAVPAVGEAD